MYKVFLLFFLFFLFGLSMLLVRIDAARDYRSLSESNGTWEGAKQGAAAKSRSMEAKKEGRTEGRYV